MENKPSFIRYKKGDHWRNHPTEYAERFAKFLKKNNFKDLIVDIGCGNGRDVNVFDQNEFNVLGIDISKESIEEDQRDFPQLKFEVQDAEELKFENEDIGAFFTINVIHYVNKEKALKEIHRTLKKGGYFFIHFNLSIIDHKGHVDYEDKEENILALLSEFKVIEKRIIERIDKDPIKHTHKIMELILQKE